uniref:Uncharacterized protein n=1 Tax=viral metagenome TaxID=1070528 RepID=A0A6H1ZJE3_9ZZZZ
MPDETPKLQAVGKPLSLNNLHERHKLIALMDVQGFTAKAIAAEVGMNEAWLSRVRSSDVYRRYVTLLRKQLNERVLEAEVETQRTLRQDMIDGVTVLKELMHGAERDSDRLGAAKAVIEHARKVTGQEKTTHVIDGRAAAGMSTDDLIKLIGDRMDA